MSDGKPPERKTASPKPGQPAREAKLAAALRANLKRRKATAPKPTRDDD